jgi:hypothetical protein
MDDYFKTRWDLKVVEGITTMEEVLRVAQE